MQSCSDLPLARLLPSAVASAAPEHPCVNVGTAAAVLELTGLGSRGGLEVLEGEVPKTPGTGWRCQQG